MTLTLLYVFVWVTDIYEFVFGLIRLNNFNVSDNILLKLALFPQCVDSLLCANGSFCQTASNLDSQCSTSEDQWATFCALTKAVLGIYIAVW